MKLRNKGLFFLCLALLMLILTGCLLPEKFDCKVSIKADGTINVVYKGTIVNGEIYTGIEESVVKNNISQIVQGNSRITEYKYLGNGKASWVYSTTIPANMDSSFFDDGFIFFTIHRNGKKIKITEPATDSETINQLKSFGYKIDGTIKFESEIELSCPDIIFKKSGNKYFGEQKITTLSTKEIVITTVN